MITTQHKLMNSLSRLGYSVKDKNNIVIESMDINCKLLLYSLANKFMITVSHVPLVYMYGIFGTCLGWRCDRTFVQSRSGMDTRPLC